MKTLFVVFLSVLIGIAFVTSVFAQYPSLTKRAMDSMERNREATAEGNAAQEKATKAVTEKAEPVSAPETKAVTEKAAPVSEKVVGAATSAKEAEKKVTSEARIHYYRGEVTAVDMAAKTLTVKGKKGDMTFDVTDAKMKGKPKAGQKVTVRYTEKDGKMVAKSVVREGVKKLPKKEAVPVPAAPVPAK